MCVHVCMLMIAFQLFYVGARGSDIFPVYKSATRLRIFRRRINCGEKREITLSKLSDACEICKHIAEFFSDATNISYMCSDSAITCVTCLPV